LAQEERKEEKKEEAVVTEIQKGEDLVVDKKTSSSVFCFMLSKILQKFLPKPDKREHCRGLII